MRLNPSRCVAALLAACIVSQVAVAQEVVSRRNPITEVVEKTKAAIVTIKVPNPRGGKDSVGSGVIVDKRDDAPVAIIVTNAHVVGTCKHPTVRLHNGNLVTGEVLFAEARWDLAAVRIRTDDETFKNLLKLKLMSTDDLIVGETVIAVGHPYGYTNTVSRGIISALDREIEMPTHDILTGLIQIDASINPGNSGGPLLNINGELIGINCAMRGEAQGIAFAINANTVRSVLSKVMSAQRIAGVNHGLVCREKVLGETGDRQRVLVASFKGEVAEGDLQAGDEIREVGARTVTNAFEVERSMWTAKPGETVQLKVQRQGKSLVVELTLAASSGAGPTASVSAAERKPVVGTPVARIVSVSER